MTANKLFQKVNELNTIINELKGSYPTLLAAIKSDPDIGMENINRIQELYDYIKDMAGGWDSIGSRFASSESGIQNINDTINDLKSIDIKYLKDEIVKAIGPYKSLREAVDNSRTVKVEVGDSGLTLDVTSLNGIQVYNIELNGMSSVDVATTQNPETLYTDVMVKELKAGMVTDLPPKSESSFESYNQQYGTFGTTGYKIATGSAGSLMPYMFEEYTKDSKNYQMLKTKHYDVLSMFSKSSSENDIRNIFRTSADLANGFLKTTISPGSVTSIIMMRKPTFLDFIRVYPYTPVAKSKFKLTVYDEGENVIGEISSYTFTPTSSNYNDYIDLQVDDVVHYVVLELISLLDTATVVTFNKLEFYAPDNPVDKEVVIAKDIKVKPEDILNGLTLNATLNYGKTRSAKVMHGLYLNKTPYTLVESSKLITANDFADSDGFRFKKSPIVGFSPTKTFLNTYRTYYTPALSTFGVVAGSYDMGWEVKDTKIEWGGSSEYLRLGDLRIELPGSFVSAPLSLFVGSRIIDIQGQKIKVTVKDMHPGCRRVLVEHASEDNNVEVFKFRCSIRGKDNTGYTVAYPSDTAISLLAPDGQTYVKGVESILYQINRYWQSHYTGSGWRYTYYYRRSMFFYFAPSNMYESNITYSAVADPSVGASGPEIYSEFVHLPVTIYVGVKEASQDSSTFEYAQKHFGNKIIDDIRASYGVDQFSKELSPEAAKHIKQKTDVYYKEFNASLYKDGFAFSDVVSSANVRFVLEQNGVYHVFKNNTWSQVLYKDIDLLGMTVDQLTSMTLAKTRDKFIGAIKILVKVPDGQSFTSLKINTIYTTLVPCAMTDIISNGMTQNELKTLNVDYIYNAIKDAPEVTLGVISAFSFKQEPCPLYTAQTYTAGGANIIRPLNTQERNDIAIEYHYRKITLTNNSTKGCSLLLKTLTPQKATLIDKATAVNIASVVEKANDLSSSTQNVDSIVSKATMTSKSYIDRAMASIVEDKREPMDAMLKMANSMKLMSFSSKSFIRFAGDSYAQFTGGAMQSTTEPHKVILPLASLVKTMRTPSVAITADVTKFTWVMKADRAPTANAIIVNNTYKYTCGIWNSSTKEITFDVTIAELKSASGITPTSVRIELTYPATGINSEVNIIPQMTSNTTPSGECCASTQYDTTNYPAWRAFDRTLEQHGWLSQSGLSSGYVGYKFANKAQKKLAKLVVTSGTYEPQHPSRMKVTGLLNNIEFTLADWFTPIWPTSVNGVITIEFPANLCEEFRIYCERPGAAYTGLSNIEAYEKDIITFDCINYVPSYSTKEIIEDSGAINIVVPSNGASEFLIGQVIPPNFELTVNNVDQIFAVDYNFEQRADGCYLKWMSKDFPLETDDEVVLTII